MTIGEIIAIACTIFASTGFWNYMTERRREKTGKLSNSDRVLRGIAHDRICYLGMQYIDQGFVHKDDYENLIEYLWVPYEALNGNGTAKKIIDEVKKLPLKD